MEKLTWTTEKRKVLELVPWEQNPRQMTRKQALDLKRSVEKFNLVEIPAINTDNTVIAGHQRLMTLKLLGRGEDEIDVRVPNRQLTEEELKEYNLRSNLNMGEWNWDALANNFELEMLKDVGFPMKQLQLFGFDPEEDEEDFDEVEAYGKNIESAVKIGDIYELGKHRIMCGDSTNPDHVKTLMGGVERTELLFTSPPYSDIRTYGGDKDLSTAHLSQFIKAYAPYCEYQAVNLGLKRKDFEIIQYWDDYIRSAKEAGYLLLAWNVWNRQTARSIGQQTAFIPIAHEWIFVFGKKFKEINKTREKADYTKHDMRTRKSRRQKDGSMQYSTTGDLTNPLTEITSVFTSNPELDNNVRKKHPATFPVVFPEEYIKALSNEGDVVVDPFLGSGTTLIAAEKTNRTCYGMEMDPVYVDVAIQRYEKATNKKAIKI